MSATPYVPYHKTVTATITHQCSVLHMSPIRKLITPPCPVKMTTVRMKYSVPSAGIAFTVYVDVDMGTLVGIMGSSDMKAHQEDSEL